MGCVGGGVSAAKAACPRLRPLVGLAERARRGVLPGVNVPQRAVRSPASGLCAALRVAGTLLVRCLARDDLGAGRGVGRRPGQAVAAMKRAGVSVEGVLRSSQAGVT